MLPGGEAGALFLRKLYIKQILDFTLSSYNKYVVVRRIWKNRLRERYAYERYGDTSGKSEFTF